MHALGATADDDENAPSSAARKQKESYINDLSKYAKLRIDPSSAYGLTASTLRSFQFADNEFLPLASVATTKPPASLRWQTCGVVTRRFEPKVSARGQSYAVIKLWDAQSICEKSTPPSGLGPGVGGMNMLSVLLSGPMFDSCFNKVSAGVVVVVANPEWQAPNGGNQPSQSSKSANFGGASSFGGPLLISKENVIIVGRAADVAPCGANVTSSSANADRDQCSVLVNKKRSPYCSFHVGRMKTAVSAAKQVPPSSAANIRQGNPNAASGSGLICVRRPSTSATTSSFVAPANKVAPAVQKSSPASATLQPFGAAAAMPPTQRQQHMVLERHPSDPKSAIAVAKANMAAKSSLADQVASLHAPAATMGEKHFASAVRSTLQAQDAEWLRSAKTGSVSSSPKSSVGSPSGPRDRASSSSVPATVPGLIIKAPVRAPAAAARVPLPSTAARAGGGGGASSLSNQKRPREGEEGPPAPPVKVPPQHPSVGASSPIITKVRRTEGAGGGLLTAGPPMAPKTADTVPVASSGKSQVVVRKRDESFYSRDDGGVSATLPDYDLERRAATGAAFTPLHSADDLNGTIRARQSSAAVTARLLSVNQSSANALANSSSTVRDAAVAALAKKASQSRLGSGLGLTADAVKSHIARAAAAQTSSHQTTSSAATDQTILGAIAAQQGHQSRHLNLLDTSAAAKHEAKLEALEREDAVFEALNSVTEQAVSAWYCHQCRRHTMRRDKGCADNGHRLEIRQTVKKFWACLRCRHMVGVFGPEPPYKMACGQCHEVGRWAPTTMANPKPDVEKDQDGQRVPEPESDNPHIRRDDDDDS